jgi:NADPH-dependent curcumin reductase CurA
MASRGMRMCIGRTHVTEGIDNAAEGFVEMLKGGNFGKAVLKIRE